MSTIVPFPPSSAHPDPAGCAPWCTEPRTRNSGNTDKTDNTSPGTVEHRCRSTVHRIDCGLGGGQGPEPVTQQPSGNTKPRDTKPRGTERVPTADAGLYLQAEQTESEPAAYVLGVEVAGTETWTRLRRNDLRTLITAGRTLLAQTPAA